MKKLTKVKLINWHLFSNQTIIVDGNTLVSGENGAGKSTFLDAIQYLLVGGRGGAKFNIAANDMAKRTLDGYVRGKIGAENKEFLRNGDVITHIALEFYDEINKTYNIVGAVLDLPKNSSLKERLYILENYAITEEMYVENNKPRDYKNMKDYLKGVGVEFDYFESQKKYRDAVSKFFGIDALKYSKLLPKALAFKPVDLQSLVFEFLLDDNPIDIQSLKNNVNQLKKVEAQIKSDREKLESLEKIKEIGNDLIKNEEQLDVNRLINNLNWVEQRETFVQNSESEISSLDRKLEQLREKRKEIEGKITQNDERILSLEKAKDSNDLSRTVDKIKQEKDSIQKEYDHQNEICANIRKMLDEEYDYLKEIIKHVPDKSMAAFCDYYSKNKNQIILKDLESHLSLVAQAIDSYDKAFYVERQNIESDKKDLSEQLNKAKQQLNSLEQNIKPYPRTVVMLTDLINKELSRKYEKEINARPFADLIDIADESWRNAVEGYLNTQRFDIIIDPIYFDEALQIYDNVKMNEKIYGVGLVNTTKLAEFDYIGENSLASKIKTDHIYARKYANMLLSQVTCCENVQDLKKFKRAVTKTGMTYGNYTARQINPNTWEVPFIGKKATETQILLAGENVKKLEEAMKMYYSQTDKNDTIQRLISRTRSKQILSQNQLMYFESVEELRKEILQLERKIESYQSDKSVKDIELELDKEREIKRNLRLDSDSLLGDITSVKDKKSQIMQNLDQTKHMLDEFVKEQKEFSESHPEKLAIAQTQYYNLKQKCGHDYQRVNDFIAKSDVSLNNLLPKLENQVVNLMREYIYKYSFNAESNKENINLFIQEANIIKNQNLVQYELQAVELRKNSETSFKEEFVNKLRASIQSAQAQIEELNVALEGKTFGSDQYKIVAYPSKDKEYQMYYNLIMGSKDFEDQSLFTEGLNKRQEQVLMELFEKIASDDPQYDKLSLNFLDYRNYMEYDIQITNQNGNISLFSNVSREKSGGETQVPFYIVIAASFQQLLSHNKRVDSGCVVLFDEAFNNMDESRIEAMMRFYNSLSIQLLISIPPQRVPNIIQYVNTSLIIVKHDDTSIIESFRSDLDILV